jgi:5,10-methylene-tetrahydrofolate dehydrogenase/Methenyl tetrahydrofolate cyclohydrolase
MECCIIDGKKIASSIKASLKERICKIREDCGIIPGLAFVIAGKDAASFSYIKNARKICTELGIFTEEHILEDTTSTNDMVSLINNLNSNDKINGIIVQLPLPGGIDEKAVRNAVSPLKDVDCISPVNFGLLFGGGKCIEPCTPKGIIKLIEHTGIDIRGKHAVIVGRSSVVGKPAAAMLLNRDATVTICHSKTKNLMEYTKSADILISAAGKPDLIRGCMIREGAVVIDAGTSFVDGKLVGDVNFEEALKAASWITPVPGGVGAMTTTMLAQNTLEAFETYVR